MNVKETEAFRRWYDGLKDKQATKLIKARLTGLAVGNTACLKPIGDGFSEIRIHFGPGYRIYCKQHGNILIIILAGGTKRRQQQDIEKAKILWALIEKDYLPPL